MDYQPSPERLLAPFDAVRYNVAAAVSVTRTLSPTLQVLFQSVADVAKSFINNNIMTLLLVLSMADVLQGTQRPK